MDIVGSGADFPSGKNSIPFCSGFGTASAGCVVTSVYGAFPISGAQAASDLSGCAANAPSAATLAAFGCYASANGKSFILPPPLGQFGNMGRNIFRDSGFHDLDLSIFKNFTFHERFGAQFRWEVFNVLNQPMICNPYGSSSAVNAGNGFQGGGPFGYAGTTPDICAGNPLIGSGSARVMQLGLRLTF